jgi:hypothetical protein
MADFILSRLKEKFGSEEDEEGGYDDMNYIIGQSSAMDMGEFPTPMDERIGMAAMTGGELMELQITNPATFTMERDKMVSVIDQLGLDVTLHPDMNAGFTSGQKTGRGEGYGYETVEQYFTEYIQELAAFKKHVNDLGDGDSPLFEIGRMNPHISTTPMPPMEERMETDVGVDPFGFVTNNYDENSRKQRRHFNQDIYKNPEFLKKLYHTLFLEEVNYPFQNYQTFAAYSNVFDQAWLKARHIAAWELFKDEAENVNDKLGAILTARQQDQGVGSAWRRILDNWEMTEKFPQYEVDAWEETNEDGEVTERGLNELNQVGTVGLEELLTAYGQNPSQLRALESILYSLRDSNSENANLSRLLESPLSLQPFISNIQEFITRAGTPQDPLPQVLDRIENKIDSRAKELEDEIERALDRLWHPNTFDPEKQNISQQAKWSALQSHLEIEQIRIFENAYQLGQDHPKMDKDIEELAMEVFSGENPGDYFDPDDRETEGLDRPEDMHEDMLERILEGQQFQREMWKESTIFYQILPAWMSEASYDEHDSHPGWKAPEFIWEALIEKWDERDGVDIDLKEPRNGVEGTDKYMDLLEKSREFRMDVAAASAACYVWGHFTQRKNIYDLKGRDFDLDEDEEEEVQNEGWTWIDWMNRFGLGVNLETMQGSPQQKFKIWRPKDIAVAAHAVNMTARKRAEDGDLGGMDHVHEELDGRPAKFTIDMEHTATMGAPPFHEMELFKDQEEDLAGKWEDLGIDEEKPIAKILRQIHLMDPGVEAQRGTYHGAIERGNTLLYEWLYNFVDWGFARNEEEAATILFELAEHQAESVYMMRVMMDMIELGIDPETDLDPSKVDPSTGPRDEEEALIGRFFGIDRASYTREWAKIEEHAFDPLKGLLEAEPFDYTYSSRAATENENRPQEWQSEEYR